jgi:polyferredoxin
VSKDLLYEIAYTEAVRALSEQQEAIDSLRSRAGLLFSAAAVTTSFLGAQALQDGHSSFASWLALLGFVATAAAFLAILWPRKWEGAVNPREVIETYIESVELGPTEDLHRDLSLHMHRSYLENHEGLEQLALFLRLASGLLTLEVVLWVVAIALRH